MINHYKILNIPENATNYEIKIAFRRLAILYHPDKNKSKEANQKFIELKSSYDILSDPIKRFFFDKELEKNRFYNNYEEILNTNKNHSQPNINKKKNIKILKYIFFYVMVLICILLTIVLFNKSKNTISNQKGNNKYFNHKTIDSIKIKDEKIENELKNLKEEKYSNGELKF